jgi:hypothetical protein
MELLVATYLSYLVPRTQKQLQSFFYYTALVAGPARSQIEKLATGPDRWPIDRPIGQRAQLVAGRNISHLPPIRETNCPIRRSRRCRRGRRFIQDCAFRALVGNNRSSNTVNWTDRSGGRGRLFRGSRLDGYLAPFAAATHLWLYSFPYKERPGLGIACGIECL